MGMFGNSTDSFFSGINANIMLFYLTEIKPEMQHEHFELICI